MSVGVNVVFAMAAKIAQALGEDYDIEIVEAHHHHKVDAPSGTAFGIADAIADATDRTRADYEYGREGHTGPREKRQNWRTCPAHGRCSRRPYGILRR